MYQGLQITMVYFLALSLDINIPIIYYALFIPIILAVSMIPVSINGLGVREAAWVLLFSQVGVSTRGLFHVHTRLAGHDCCQPSGRSLLLFRPPASVAAVYGLDITGRS